MFEDWDVFRNQLTFSKLIDVGHAMFVRKHKKSMIQHLDSIRTVFEPQHSYLHSDANNRVQFIRYHSKLTRGVLRTP